MKRQDSTTPAAVPHTGWAASWTLGLLALLVFAAMVRATWPFTVDDAYITFRYATNLAAGRGFVFNAGEPPVEGFTSFLWTLCCALGAASGHVVAFAKILSTAFAIGTLVATYQLARRLDVSPTGSMGAVFMATCIPDLAGHAASGMETTLAALLFTLLVIRALGVKPGVQPRDGWILGGLSLLLGLARPECNAVATGIAIVLVATGGRRLVPGYLFAYVLPGALYFAWRVATFHTLLPLPFYIKAGAGGLQGLRYVASFGGWVVVHAGIWVASGLMVSRRRELLILAPCLLLPLFFLVPEPLMGYGRRYLFPLVPLVCALSARGVEFASTKLPTERWCHWEIAALAVFAGFLLALRVPTDLPFYRSYAAGLRAAHEELGHELAGMRHGDPLLAIGDAGAVPFLSGWRTLDTFGLNNREIALGGDKARRAAMKARPDVLVLISERTDQFQARLSWETSLEAEATRLGYKRVRLLKFRDKYYLWVMARAEWWEAAGLGKSEE